MALTTQIKEDLERYVAAGKLSGSPGLLESVRELSPEQSDLLGDLLCGNLPIPLDEAQRLLSDADPLRLLRAAASSLRKEMLVLELQEGIRSKSRDSLSRAQREHYLREQLRQIQGELSGESGDELSELRDKLQRAGLCGEAQREAERQLRRLEGLPSGSAETHVIRTHLEWMAELPWQVKSTEAFDLLEVRRALSEDHDGLEGVKDRILEFLSVLRLRQQAALGSSRTSGGAGPSEQRRGARLGQILCFVGPPGVGKTSLGRSIGRALGRRFARISLGGVRDDAEIRGHRRTYVGAMPGRLLQGLRQAQSRNPVLLLDEVDKLCADSHGDPGAALLEVLDPEQNGSFRDHYLGVPFDLSDVLFIATANDADRIPSALRDRLELIHLSGYTEQEKLAIATRHIVPRALTDTALLPSHPVAFAPAALRALIRGYTREAGLRELERQLLSICRKIAHTIVVRQDAFSALAALPGVPARTAGQTQPLTITERAVQKYLGPATRRPLCDARVAEPSAVGRALGLAWTPVGGEVIEVESLAISRRVTQDGPIALTLTGQLGEIMRESAQAALSFARARAGTGLLEACPTEIHLHLPAGAVPKDGPSAGVTLACALYSLLTKRPVRGDVGMTGEITLRGRILAVGGIREKLLAAQQLGLKEVIVPRGNEGDLVGLPASLRQHLTIHLVEHMDELLALALLDRAACEKTVTKPGRKRRNEAAGLAAHDRTT